MKAEVMDEAKQCNLISVVDIKGIKFETERLILRACTGDDFAVLHALRSQEEVVRYLYGGVQSPEDTKALIDNRLKMNSFDKDGDKFVLAVVEKSSGEFVGDIALNLTNAKACQGEVGFVFNPRFQGRGYGYEAAYEMLRFGFEVVGLHRIAGRCDGQNKSSAGLLKKLGLKQEAHLVENEWVKGAWRDELIFALRRNEWVTMAGE